MSDAVVRKSVIVGVERYLHLDDAPGCAGRATAVAERLTWPLPDVDADGIGWGDRAGSLLTSSVESPLDQHDLEAALDRSLRDCDEFLFYFAGHGLARPARNDLWLATAEHEPFGQHGSGLSLSGLMDRIASSPRIARAIIILDCRDSGSVRGVTVPSGQLVMTVADGSDEVALSWSDRTPELAFTDALLEGLDGAAKDPMGKITALSLFAYASNRLSDTRLWEPILVGRLVGSWLIQQQHGLRVQDLDRLPDLFETATSSVPLTPDHEWPDVVAVKHPYEFRSRPHDWSEDRLDEYVADGVLDQHEADLQRDQQFFKRLRDAGLLRVTEPAGKDLFWACLSNEGAVALTELGRYYWALANKPGGLAAGGEPRL